MNDFFESRGVEETARGTCFGKPRRALLLGPALILADDERYVRSFIGTWSEGLWAGRRRGGNRRGIRDQENTIVRDKLITQENNA